MKEKHLWRYKDLTHIEPIFYYVNTFYMGIVFEITFKRKKSAKKNTCFSIQYIHRASDLKLYILISSVDYIKLWIILVQYKRIGIVS